MSTFTVELMSGSLRTSLELGESNLVHNLNSDFLM